LFRTIYRLKNIQKLSRKKPPLLASLSDEEKNRAAKGRTQQSVTPGFELDASPATIVKNLSHPG